MVPVAASDRRTLKEMARTLLDDAGFVEVEENVRVAPGVTVSFRAVGRDGMTRLFELGGAHTPARPGLSRLDAVWRTIAKAAIAQQTAPEIEFVVLTSGSVRGGPLATVVGDGGPIVTIVDVTSPEALERLVALCDE
jgi:site-specific DNA-methyltransferase (adenine-specific)